MKRIAKASAALLLAAVLAGGASAEAARYISASKAKSIALQKAGYRAAAVKFVKAKRERDDGRMIYDIEFRLRKNRRIEYEFEIDAVSGRIIEWDRDYDD